MNEMPWWAILAIVFAAFFCMFIYMGIGVTTGEYAANVFLVSVLALAALVVAAVRWCFPSKADKP